MGTTHELLSSRSGRFRVAVGLAGLAVLAWSLLALDLPALHYPQSLAPLAVPLIVLMARFPVVLDGRGTASGVEIGFDSSVLMFLLSSLRAPEALVVWCLGVLITQLTTGKLLSAKVFNIGVGMLAGGVAAVVFHTARGAAHISLRELAAVALAATGYFLTDYVVSAFALAVEAGTSVKESLSAPGVLPAVGCFVAFDLLGYLAAVVLRVAPWWLVLLLAVPLGTLLVATRAVTRAQENARRLQVLLDAAVRAQTLYEPAQVGEALVEDACALLKLAEVEVRSTPPGAGELGAQVLRGKDGTWVVAPARQRARSSRRADQQALEALAAVASDAYGRLQLTDDMVHFARHDPLTDLPNRGILQDRLARAVQLVRRHSGPVSLLLIDLDGFKPVNDRFGHAAGDKVLVHVADTLVRSVRATDTVARLGGDEFAVLLEDIEPEHTMTLCRRILSALGAGVEVAGRVVPLSASIGVTYADRDATTESLLRQADLAMYEAKARGKSLAVEYDASLGDERLRKLEMVDLLRRAVATDDIALVYEPVVELSTGRIVGLESQPRWDLDGEPVAPEVFLPLAEEIGVAVSLSERIVTRAVQDAVRVRSHGSTDLNVSVRISAHHLRDADFMAAVRRGADRLEDGLILELTEGDRVGEDEVVRAAMEHLVSVGVHFAIADAAAGFSSFGFLRDVPAHIVKVDQALSRTIDSDERARLLLRSIVGLGPDLGVDVVVMGIERQSQLELVRDHMHACYAQGPLLHEPMALDEVLTLLDRGPLRVAAS